MASAAPAASRGAPASRPADAYLPHARRVMLPMERALSYTLGHKKGCCELDRHGHVLNARGGVPAVVHQYNKGAAGRALQNTKFFSKYLWEPATPRASV